MSNTQHIDPAKPIRGNFGLGLCLACLNEHMMAAAQTAAALANPERTVALPRPPRQPHFAITMAPSPVPVPGPDGTVQGLGIVTLPSCYDHLTTTAPGPAAPRARLLVPGPPG
jgi:hypothetical protein